MLNFGIILLSGKGTSVWPLPLTDPEPALTATRGVAAGGCKIQVLMSEMCCYSCAIWVFGRFLLLCRSCLHFGLCWTVKHLWKQECLLSQIIYDSPLSSLMPFMMNYSSESYLTHFFASFERSRTVCLEKREGHWVCYMFSVILFAFCFPPLCWEMLL